MLIKNGREIHRVSKRTYKKVLEAITREEDYRALIGKSIGAVEINLMDVTPDGARFLLRNLKHG